MLIWSSSASTNWLVFYTVDVHIGERSCPMAAVDLRIRDSLVFDETLKDLAPVEQSELR